MSRFVRVGFVLALLPVAACSSMNTPPPIPAAPAAPSLAAGDAMFVAQAANAGEAEVEFGQLAATKARRPGIRKFAGEMVTDHTIMNQQLAQLATQKGVTVTPMLDQAQTDMLAKLKGETGAAFDQDYIHGQVMDHQTTIALFAQEAADGRQPGQPQTDGNRS